jgi:PRTRC genetic system protein A
MIFPEKPVATAADHSAVDDALLRTQPVVAVPPSGEPPWPANVTGTRLLVARNGIFLDACSPVLRILLKIGDYGQPLAPPGNMPYGEVAADPQRIDWLVAQPPKALLLDAFIRQARREWPHETAAWIIYNQIAQNWRIQPSQIVTSSEHHLRYRPPAVLRGDVLACDIHSHGELPAFFSAADDEDDRADSGAVKLSVVYGKVRAPTVQTRVRPVAGGVLGTCWDWQLAVGFVPPEPTALGVEPEVLPPAGEEHPDVSPSLGGGPQAVPPWAAGAQG